MQSLRTAASVLPFALILLAAGCKPSASRVEVAREWSPDGLVAATLYEENGGATTSFGYVVELRQKGLDEAIPVARLYGAQRNEQAYGVDLRWTNNETLLIECLSLKGQPSVSSSVASGGRHIAVILRTGISDPRAPAGGMLFNLQRTKR